MPTPHPSRRVPSTEDLQTFVSIVDEGSLNGASRALRQPKATLSRRLARLEAVLDVRLFVRNRHQLALTESGLALLESARLALTTLGELADAADEGRAVPKGRLRVSIPIDILGRRDVWLEFIERHEGVALELEPTNRFVDPVAERFDLALRGGRGPDESLVARAVGRYQLVAVASPRYVERWGALDAPTDLRRHSCVLFAAMRHRPGHPDRPDLPHRHVLCPDEATAVEAALRGLAIAILRKEVVDAHMADGSLVPVLDGYNPLDVPLYAVYPERAHLRAAVSAFIEHVAARFT